MPCNFDNDPEIEEIVRLCKNNDLEGFRHEEVIGVTIFSLCLAKCVMEDFVILSMVFFLATMLLSMSCLIRFLVSRECMRHRRNVEKMEEIINKPTLQQHEHTTTVLYTQPSEELMGRIRKFSEYLRQMEKISEGKK
jgi:hypothetical protein